MICIKAEWEEINQHEELTFSSVLSYLSLRNEHCLDNYCIIHVFSKYLLSIHSVHCTEPPKYYKDGSNEVQAVKKPHILVDRQGLCLHKSKTRNIQASHR